MGICKYGFCIYEVHTKSLGGKLPTPLIFVSGKNKNYRERFYEKIYLDNQNCLLKNSSVFYATKAFVLTFSMILRMSFHIEISVNISTILP